MMLKLLKDVIDDEFYKKKISPYASLDAAIHTKHTVRRKNVQEEWIKFIIKEKGDEV